MSTASDAGDAGAEIAIRARRAAFNRAIAEGEAGAIGPLLARHAVMVTGSDSAVILGRAEQVKVWKREFAGVGRMVYLRMPERVTVSGTEPVAIEHGRWQGKQGSAVAAAGEYTAKWRLAGGEWVIEAEVYVTL